MAHAYDAYTEAFALCEALDDKIGMTRLRQQFGMEKYHNADFVGAQACFEEALQLCEAHQYAAGIGNALRNLGRALFQQQRFAEADQYFAEAWQRAQARGDLLFAARRAGCYERGERDTRGGREGSHAGQFTGALQAGPPEHRQA